MTEEETVHRARTKSAQHPFEGSSAMASAAEPNPEASPNIAAARRDARQRYMKTELGAAYDDADPLLAPTPPRRAGTREDLSPIAVGPDVYQLPAWEHSPPHEPAEAEVGADDEDEQQRISPGEVLSRPGPPRNRGSL